MTDTFWIVANTFVATTGWTCWTILWLAFCRLEREYNASERLWTKAWAERETEFLAMSVNKNVDPFIDPFYDADTRPGAGEFAHLVTSDENGTRSIALSDPLAERWNGEHQLDFRDIVIDVSTESANVTKPNSAQRKDIET